MKMKTNKTIMLAILMSLFLVAMNLASVSAECVSGGVAVDAHLTPETIGFGDTTTMEIALVGSGTSASFFPVDIVLTIDCSGSMERYGSILPPGTKQVQLTTSYQKLGEFSISQVTDVEVMLQIPEDVYYKKDQFNAKLRNKDTGVNYSSSPLNAYSSARWDDQPSGTYEVYAKLLQSGGTASRTYAVEVPPVRLDSAKGAAKTFVDMMTANDQIALVRFQSQGWSYKDFCTVKQALDDNKDMMKNNIDSLNPSGGTPLGEGLMVAIDHLDAKGRGNAEKAIILLTDGWWNMGVDPMVQADRAAAKGYTVYTIGWGGVNETALLQIAERTGGRGYFPITAEDLVQIYTDLAIELTNITAKNATVMIELSDDVEYVGNANIAPTTINGNILTWNLGMISKDQIKSISFEVKPKTNGTVQVNTANSKVTYENACNEQGQVAVPVLNVNVIRYPPKAILTGPSTPVNKNESFKLDASKSYDPDGYIVEYRWDFGDNTPDIVGNVLMINHSYNTSGNKTVTLTVKDNSGAINVTTITITVTNEDVGGVSGKVQWDGEHVIQCLDSFVGESQLITATAIGITRINTNDTISVTVYLYADGELLSSTPVTLSDNSPKNVPVSGMWSPMISGRHFISLRAEAEAGVTWVAPTTNDPTAGVRVYIKKVT